MDCLKLRDYEVTVEEREKTSVVTIFDDMAVKSTSNWRKLFSALLDQSLKYFPPLLVAK